MENNEHIDNLGVELEGMFNRIIESNRLSQNEILILCQYGITSGLIFINNIMKTIEERGEKAAGKIFSGDKISLILNSINSEFYYRTNHFYEKGQGFQIPEQLGFAHIKLTQVIYDLEAEMLYGNSELSTEINQRELAFLFSALAEAEIFHSSSDLLASSLGKITNYSENSIRRVVLDLKKTKGGWVKDDKEKLLNKLSIIIHSF
jgi:hypothetical protein